MFIVAQLLPILPDSFHIWSLLGFLQKCTLQKPEGQSEEGGGQRKEIQHEGKGVETIRKATKRGRKTGQGKKIITGGKKTASLAAHFQEETERAGAKQHTRARFFSFFFLPLLFLGAENCLL